jgi:hypothetical protein
MYTASRFAFLSTVLCLCACASSTAPTKQESDSGAGGADAGSDAPGVVLAAPVLTTLMKMTGGLHVMWTNKQPDCDAIEGERKSATEEYKVVFTVPDGTVDNKHDGSLTAGTAYTYRLRCKKGADYSPYSNEKTGTP